MSMDHSANSGSAQSSSVDVDFDSRAADSFSALFNFSSTAGAAAGSSLPLPGSSRHYQLLDPLSYLDRSSPFPTNPTSTAASVPTSNSWTSPHPHHVPTCTTDFPSLTNPAPSSTNITSSRPFPAADPHPMPVQQTELTAATGSSAAAAATARRSSKKRSRASRRAPTTVLTTDTSNFRAMVQEFTGIPSPPFAAGGGSSALFPGRSRFDFFSSAAPCRSPANTDSPILPSQYLLRTFAQKAQDFTSRKMINLISSPNTTSSNIANANVSVPNPSLNTINPTNYMSSYDILGPGNQCKSLSNTQTPVLDLQSLIQPSLHPAFALPTMIHAPFNTRTQTLASTANTILGLPPGVMTGSSEILHSNWSTGATFASESNNIYQAQFRSMAGDYAAFQQQDGSNCKQNFSSPDLSEINPAEKIPETVPAPRGEGMLEYGFVPQIN